MGIADLEELVLHGDMDAIRVHLKASAPEDLNVVNSFGNSLVSFAVRCGDSNLVRELCMSGLNVNLCDLSLGGEPPIMYAIDQEDREMINLLIELGADLDMACWMGVTPRERLQQLEG